MASATTEKSVESSMEDATAQGDQTPAIPALDPDQVAECLRAGRPIKELLGLGDDVWETMYDFGYRNFINAQYPLAEYWWTQTCLFDSEKDRNWIALGVACKRQKKYEQALNAFSLAVHNGTTNAWAPLHAAECHLQLNQPLRASTALDDVEAWAENSDDKDVILQRAKMLRRGIQQRLAKKQPPTAAAPVQDSDETFVEVSNSAST